MTLVIRPIEANIIHDPDMFCRLVSFSPFRTPIAKSISEGKPCELKLAIMVANIRTGEKPSPSTTAAIKILELRSGTSIPSATISLLAPVL